MINLAYATLKCDKDMFTLDNRLKSDYDMLQELLKELDNVNDYHNLGDNATASMLALKANPVSYSDDNKLSPVIDNEYVIGWLLAMGLQLRTILTDCKLTPSMLHGVRHFLCIENSDASDNDDYNRPSLNGSSYLVQSSNDYDFMVRIPIAYIEAGKVIDNMMPEELIIETLKSYDYSDNHISIEYNEYVI